jgi:hypothetical protein
MTSTTPSAFENEPGSRSMGRERGTNMTHIEEEKVTKTTTYERVDDPPKEPVKNVNLNVNTDGDAKTVTVDETTVETTDAQKPQVNVNIAR